MTTGRSLVKLLSMALSAVLFLGTIQAQSFAANSKTVMSSLNTQRSNDNPVSSARVKWTWQLPARVRNAFNKSDYANWYIEKMIRYDSAEKTVYKFLINNGSLLDSDHYDSFLKKASIDISEKGIVFVSQSPN